MRRGIFFALLSGALVSALALALVVAAFLQPRLFHHLLVAQPRLGGKPGQISARQSNADLVAQVNPGVVTVVVVRAERATAALRAGDEFALEPSTPQSPSPDVRAQRGYGTGFIIDPGGYIVTNDHVVRDADRIKIKLADGRERKAVVQGSDRPTDLALLKIEATELAALPLGDSDAVRVGDPVIAIGNPLDYERSVTSGIISAKGRKVYHSPPFEDYLQTDAAINRGNSGGPLLNLAGEVIGVNTIIRVDGRGISFAIPSNIVRQVVAQLRAQGYVARGYLGVTPQNLTAEFRDGLGVGSVRGVLVSVVKAETAAARAGIQAYDVITRFDGRAINNTDEFFSLVANTAPQREVELEVVRGGRTLRLRATLEQRDLEPGRARQAEPLSPLQKTSSRLGFSVRDNTPEVQRALRVGVWTGEVTGGVIVSEVDPLSPAADTGLAVGHVILEANRQLVNNPRDFQRLVGRLRDGEALVLRISSPHQKNSALVAIRVGEER
jgi:Do/DeqQ family serine protease